MKATIIGKIDTEKKQIGLYKSTVTRKSQQDDIVLAGGEFYRMIPNHNGQRLTSQFITDLVQAAWAKSEAAR